MYIHIHHNDLPDTLKLKGDIAIDCEAMGLVTNRDRICTAQMCERDGDVHIVKFDGDNYSAPNLKAVLTNPDQTKILHFARFDMALILHWLGTEMWPVYCTKIASEIARTYSRDHSFKTIVREALGAELNKAEQSSDWGQATLSAAQKDYAVKDVIYMHALRDHFNAMLQRENRADLVQGCLQYLPTRAKLDVAGYRGITPEAYGNG